MYKNPLIVTNLDNLLLLLIKINIITKYFIILLWKKRLISFIK